MSATLPEDALAPDEYERRVEYEGCVEAMAAALHEDCRLEWQAKAVVSPGVQLTMHGPDAHYGKAHALVRRLVPVWPSHEQGIVVSALGRSGSER